MKVEPQYKNDAVIYVADASRAVGVATSLLSTELKSGFVAGRKQEYEEVRIRHANRKPKAERLAYAQAVEMGFTTDWTSYTPPAPKQPGITVLQDYPLERLLDYIDWTPFFRAWELAGKDARGNAAPAGTVLVDAHNNQVVDLRSAGGKHARGADIISAGEGRPTFRYPASLPMEAGRWSFAVGEKAELFF
mgnify:CR=1 FL=1